MMLFLRLMLLALMLTLISGCGSSATDNSSSSSLSNERGEVSQESSEDSEIEPASNENDGDTEDVTQQGDHETETDVISQQNDEELNSGGVTQESNNDAESDEGSHENEDDENGGTVTSDTGSGGTTPTTPTTPTPTSSGYALLAWNDLGMHCMDGKDYSVFSILPPYNTLNAQLLKRSGTSNKHVTSGVTITYQAAASLDGKYNTTSLLDSQNNLKTNFWDYVLPLFNTTLTEDVGLAGYATASATPNQLHYSVLHNWWEATGIPMTPYNDDGSKNYYPMVDVIASDSSGAVLATTTVVLPVSDEMDCTACHSSTSGYSDARPAAGWENDANSERDYKWNILRLHDDKVPTAVSSNLTALETAGYSNYNSAGLYATAKAGNPVLCATCHSSNALPGTGVAGVKPLTEALHTLHANVTDPANGMSLGSSSNRSSCYTCHPGATTKCLRGAMGKQSNIQCQSCHGSMSAVGKHARNGWLEEPNCQSCHQNGMRYTEAVTDQMTGTLRAALDNRFATNPDTPAAGVSLYRYSKGHGDMKCSSCHGSTHAIYPSSHEEDNLQSIALQGHEGTIGECMACHDTMPQTTNEGPHGMHTVGQDWVRNHEDVAERNSAQCKTCHGQDYRGSVLSKTFSNRSFSTEWGTKNFASGHEISCYDCHNGPSGD